MRRYREDELDFTHIGREADAATHAGNITSPGHESHATGQGGPGMMPGNPREMITAAEPSHPMRVRIGVPPGGPGRRLSQETWQAWLREEAADLRQLKALLAPYPSEAMACWPVSARVGNIKNNDPSLIEPRAIGLD
jgi:SOS response associated peptidase (SRAP)